MLRIARAVNFLAYPLLWFMLVYFASLGKPWYAVILIVFYLFIHTTLFVPRCKQSYFLMLVISLSYGLIIEGLFKGFSVLEYSSDPFEQSIFPPYWVLFLYPLFASACSLFFAFLKDKLVFSMFLGGLFGPLAYYNASLLQAVFFSDEIYFSWGLLSFFWMLTFPFMIRLTNTCKWYELDSPECAEEISFAFESVFPVSSKNLFSWHESPDAIVKMLPSNGSVDLVKSSQSLQVGEEVHLKVRVGIFSILWVARHVAFEKNVMFEDVQEKGPFQSWRHRHLFQDLRGGKTQLRDEVAFSLPFNKWTHPLFANLILSNLKKAFKERHEVLLEEFSMKKD